MSSSNTTALVKRHQPMVLTEVATSIARRAGALVMEQLPLGRFAGGIQQKSGREMVSEVDRASEALIVKALHANFPSHAVLAEEAGAQKGAADAEVRWLVDPIDGTTNFLHGHPMFAVSLAAEAQGELLAGVVYLPYLNEMFFAAAGEGAFLNSSNVRLAVSPCAALDDALVATGFAYDRERYDNMANFQRIADRALGVRRCGSAATDLAYVAAGRYDAYWEMGLRPWDVAAGALLVKEAGGAVCTFDGGPDILASGEVVAGNAAMRGQIRALLVS